MTDVSRLTDPSEIVRAFCAAWPALDLDRIMSFFADDAVYHNIPVEPVTGREAIRATIEGFTTGVDEIVVEIRHLAVVGNVVLTERVDIFRSAAGDVSLPVMGTFELTADGRIAAWRDYFDLQQFLTQVPPGS